MADEAFRTTLGVTSAERLLIDRVWAEELRRNRWRRRGWRLLHRLRVLPVLRFSSRFAYRKEFPSPD
ncbi:MAG: hypothetical protein LC793_22415 [Thermomicrobia bacterium]|nr:hypothetical protein [Thermomicrobia bacterium]